ncbi:Bug family tripartite tricarboxylate transporter substrate binding protein [Marinomonas piezotolerans]|nr:tripartite tricarboxylate transporter substrate binding protein [Marinomonas piezotolerans]
MMKLSSSKLIKCSALALLVGISSAYANDFPTKPITVVVPYGAGGTTDISARKLSSLAEAELGQPIVVENRPGASGTNAMRSVANARADGYTLIATTSSPLFVTPAVRPVGYDSVKDFTPILNYSGPYHGVLVPADSPYKTFDGLIKAAKSGTSISYGTAGAMGGPHLSFELIARQTGAKLKHVPFNGAGSATAAVLGKHVDVALVPAYRDLVLDSKLRLLGVLDDSRDPDFESVPTLKEAGYDVEFPSVVGVMAPAGTDPEIVEQLEMTFTKVAKSDEFKAFMTKLNQPVRVMTGEKLGGIIQSNLETYRNVAKELSQK